MRPPSIPPASEDGSQPRSTAIRSKLRHWSTRISESASEWWRTRWDQPWPPDPSMWRLVRRLRSLGDVLRTLSRHIAFVTTSFLVAGGVIFFSYFSHINFMPDITIGSAIFLLTFAVTGIVLQTFIPLIIMLPAIFARFFVDQQHTIRDAFLWYFIPALVLILSGFVLDSYLMIITLLIAISGVALLDSKARKPRVKKVALEILMVYLSIVSITFTALVGSAVIADSQQPAVDGYISVFLVELFIITVLLNMMLLVMPIAAGSRMVVALLFLAAPSLILFTLNPIFIPKRVMAIYGIGNFTAESLVLAEAGCTSARYLGLKMTTVSADEKTCALSHAKILSRLGSTLFVEADRHEGKSVRFTIPAPNVLSWSRKQ